MKSFTVRVNDVGEIDERVTVLVSDSMDLGRAAQLAVDDVVDRHGSEFVLPMSIHIQAGATSNSVQLKSAAPSS